MRRREKETGGKIGGELATHQDTEKKNGRSKDYS
jgi:hypothetical protein